MLRSLLQKNRVQVVVARSQLAVVGTRKMKAYLQQAEVVLQLAVLVLQLGSYLLAQKKGERLLQSSGSF